MSEESTSHPTVVLDIGKRKPKQVKRLRQGRGRLLARVEAEVDALREAGEIAGPTQTVIVVVERKRRRNWLRL